jgi:restriction system protein
LSRAPFSSIAADGEIHVGDATDRLARGLNLTAEDRAMMLPSGRQSLLSNRMHWAKTYMLKAGLVRSTRRGHFAITDRGRDALASLMIRYGVGVRTEQSILLKKLDEDFFLDE